MLPIISLNMVLSLVVFGLSLVIPLILMYSSGEKFNYAELPALLVKYALFFNVGCLFLAGFLG